MIRTISLESKKYLSSEAISELPLNSSVSIYMIFSKKATSQDFRLDLSEDLQSKFCTP